MAKHAPLRPCASNRPKFDPTGFAANPKVVLSNPVMVIFGAVVQTCTIAFGLLGVSVLPRLEASLLSFFVFWAVAFASLCIALRAASAFSSVIESDFELSTLGKEAMLAAVASAIEAGFAWLIAVYAPAGARGMLIPLVLVGLIYRVAHYDTWSHIDAILVLGLQIAIFAFGASVVLGKFVFALVVAGLVVLFLSLFAALARNL